MRPHIDIVMMRIAVELAKRATCPKRSVGCVLVDKWGKILATGYNGVPCGVEHCTDTPCAGANMPQGSDTCQAVHAEMNALLMCSDVEKINTCYCTCLPCNTCMKTLMNTGCKKLVVLSENIEHLPTAFQMWSTDNRLILQLSKGCL